MPPIGPGSVLSLLQTIVAIILSKIRVRFLPACLADMAHQGLRLMHTIADRKPATAAATKSRERSGGEPVRPRPASVTL